MSAQVIQLAGRRPPAEALSLPRCEATPITMCVCGGMLDYQCGLWCHVEACVECYDSPSRCPVRHQHAACVDPEPVQCDHQLCPQQVELDLGCAYGGDPRSCCGCCWQMSDDREGRRLWPMTH